MAPSPNRNNQEGSWGYVVALSGFMIQVVSFGISTSIGVFNIAFLDYFKSSVAAISLVGSINIGMLLGAGPVASYLMRKMTYRKVALLGSLLSSVGLLACPFAPNIIYLDVFYGALTGLGFCLVYVPSHTLSGLYFDKCRSLVTGVVTSGSGLGGVILPILTHHLIVEYGWRGSMLILAGISMNNFAFAALLLDVPRPNKELVETGEEQKLDSGLQENSSNQRHTGTYLNGIGTDENELTPLGNCSTSELPLQASNSRTSPSNELEIQVESKYEETTKILDERQENVETDPLRFNTSETKKVKNCYILFNFVFLIYCINNVLWNMGLSTLFVLGPEYFTEVGLSVQDSTIGLMCFNGTVTLGGALGGAIGNIKCINRMALYICANFAAGLFTIFLAVSFFHSFIGICIVMFCLGLATGIILGLLVVVTADIVGVQSLGDGMGYLLLANGIGCTSGPPIGGWIKDMTGSCTLAFYLAGIVTLAAGLVMLIVPVRNCCLPGVVGEKDTLEDRNHEELS